MKTLNVVLKGLADAVAVACCMLAAVCALPTAFAIGFSLKGLILFCTIAALLLSFGMNMPRFGIVVGAAFLLGMLLFIVFGYGLLRDGGVFYLDTVLGEVRDSVTIVPDLSGLDALAAEVTEPERAVTAFLSGVAALIGLLASFSLIRGKLLLLPALIPLPMFLLGMVYTNCRPALWTAVLMALWCGYTLFGHGVRKGEPQQAGAFFSILAALMLGFGFLILAIAPERSFTPISFEERKRMLGNRFEQVEDLFIGTFGKSNPSTVNLNDLGDREESEETAFELYATKAGTYLLRTHSYGAYENGRWLAAKEYDGAFRSMEALGSGRRAKTVLSISSYRSNERLVPYGFIRPASVPDDAQPDESVSYQRYDRTEWYVVPGESGVKTRGRTSYVWDVSAFDVNERGPVASDERAYVRFIEEQYVMPDGPEKRALRSLANRNGISRGEDAYETATRVAAFVRRSGRYALSPAPLPDGKDFVMYFLTESHEGYCVHFASATTAMLQAIDVPARYTVGYCARIRTANDWVPIPESASHAWAEVYVEGVGWVPIESTSGFDYDPTSPISTAEPYAAPTITPAPGAVTPEPSAPATPQPTEAPLDAPETLQPPVTPDADRTPEPASASPNGQGGGGASGGTPKRNGALWLLLLIPLAPAAWIFAGTLRRRRREARFRDKNVRRSIPEIAYYLKRLERFGAPKDPDAEEWATEAAFSDHKMHREHRILLKRVKEAQDALYADRPVRRFFCRWIRFVI